MEMVVLDRAAQREMIRRRRRCGADHHDEVWDGVYIMSPDPTNEHQEICGDLHFAFKSSLSAVAKARVLPGCNITDLSEKWMRNFRVPDVAVFLPGNPAEDRDTHWLGGPDFAVEVLSPNDRARKKFAFHAKVGVRELLLVDRKPWRLELYRAEGSGMKRVGRVIPGSSEVLTSEVLPLAFRLVAGEARPMIEITQAADARTWLA